MKNFFNKWHWLIVFAIFLLGTVWVAWPVLHNFSQILFGHQNDALGTLWGLWWTKESVLYWGIMPTSSSMLNNPFGVIIPFVSPLNYLITLIITANWGAIASYNSAVLISFPLTALAGYLLVEYLTKNKLAGFLAGLVIALSPYHLTQAVSFIDLAQAQWLIFYIYFLIRTAEEPRGINLLCANIFLWLVILSNQYYTVFATFLTILFVIWYLIARKKLAKPLFLDAKRYNLIFKINVIIYTVLVVGGYILFSINRAKFPLPSMSDLISHGGAKIWYFLLPDESHPLLGHWVNTLRPGFSLSIQTIYLGIVPLLLAIFSLLIFKKLSDNKSKFFYLFFLWLAVFSAILTIKPIVGLGHFSLYTPMFFIYKAFPFVKILTRFALLIEISLVVLGGYLLAYLFGKIKKTGYCLLILIILSVGVVFEFLPNRFSTDLSQIPPEYLWLKDQLGDFSIAEYPFFTINPYYWSQIYYQTIHHKKLVNNYQFKNLNEKAMNQMAPPTDLNSQQKESPDYLASIGAKYIIVHTKGFDEDQNRLIKSEVDIRRFYNNPKLKLIKEFPSALVFEVVDAKPEIYAANYSLFIDGEFRDLNDIENINRTLKELDNQEIITFFPGKKTDEEAIKASNNLTIYIKPDMMKLSEDDIFEAKANILDNRDYQVWVKPDVRLEGFLNIDGQQIDLSKIKTKNQDSDWAMTPNIPISSGEKEISIVPRQVEKDLIVYPEEIKVNDVFKKNLSEINISGRYFEEGNDNVLEIKAKNTIAGVQFGVKNFEPNALYRLSFETKNISGREPRFVTLQAGAPINLPLPEETIKTKKNEWTKFDYTFRPYGSATWMGIEFYADSYLKDEPETVNLYKNIKLEKIIPPISSLIIRAVPKEKLAPSPQVSFEKLGDRDYQANVTQATGDYFLTLQEPYSTNWKAYIVDENDNYQKINEEKHLVGNAFANTWVINDPSAQKIIIRYESTSKALFYTLMFLLPVGLLLLIIILMPKKYR